MTFAGRLFLRYGFVCFMIVATNLFFTAIPVVSVAAAALPTPTSHAKATALIDVTSGRLLYSSRGDEPMLIASLTKIMTAIVAIEDGNLSDTVTVSTRAAGKEGSSIYLKAGEKMKLQDMLYGLMLRSGNDAATAVAEHVGGSLDGFVYLMNKKAEAIGMKNSHFANPSGLDQKGHYASANDMAKLTAYALRNETFSKIVSTKVKTAPNPNDEWDYKWVNKNKMLTMYDGADGVKTGYTKQALRCLVSSATRDGQQLAAVTLNDGDDWADHKALLDFGFKYYPLKEVVKKEEPVVDYPYRTTAGFSYPFAEGERERLRIRLTPYAVTDTNYALGYRGKLTFLLDDRDIGAVTLVQQLPSSTATPGTSAEPSSQTSAARATQEKARASLSGALRRTLHAMLSL